MKETGTKKSNSSARMNILWGQSHINFMKDEFHSAEHCSHCTLLNATTSTWRAKKKSNIVPILLEYFEDVEFLKLSATSFSVSLSKLICCPCCTRRENENISLEIIKLNKSICYSNIVWGCAHVLDIYFGVIICHLQDTILSHT